VSGETERAQQRPHLVVIVAFVQTHPLRLGFAWLRPLNDDTLQRRSYPFHIVPIGAIHRQTDPNAMPPGQQTPFRALFAAISRIVSVFFPAQRRFVIAPSILNHFQSIPFSSSNCSTPTYHSRRKTPAATHA
jgi:hypothetical protein